MYRRRTQKKAFTRNATLEADVALCSLGLCPSPGSVRAVCFSAGRRVPLASRLGSEACVCVSSVPMRLVVHRLRLFF